MALPGDTVGSLKEMRTADAAVDASDNDDEFSDSISLEAYGARLKQLRLMKRMSQADLSKKARISVAMLSHIERAQATPSLQTLDRIRMALGLPLSDLLLGIDERADQDRSLVVKARNRVHMKSASPGVMKELLSPVRASNMEMMMLVLEPGAHSGSEPWVRSGEKAGLVISGHFSLVVGSQTFDLEPGDSFQFDGNVPHMFRNLSPGETRVMWIINSDSAG
jgi:transcriptional regulator with XRE-family HTH domain